MSADISVTFTEAKEKKKSLITYDQRLVFSGRDIERLLEFALEVEGGLFSVNKETSRKRRGLVVFTAFKLTSFEESLHG